MHPQPWIFLHDVICTKIPFLWNNTDAIQLQIKAFQEKHAHLYKDKRNGMCSCDSGLFRYIDSHTNTRNQPHRNMEVKMVGEKLGEGSITFLSVHPQEGCTFPFLIEFHLTIRSLWFVARGWGWSVLFYSPWISPISQCMLLHSTTRCSNKFLSSVPCRSKIYFHLLNIYFLFNWIVSNALFMRRWTFIP